MKAAILLPGLVRTWKKTYKNLVDNLINPNKDKYKIDIYLAFWRHSHTRGDLENKNITTVSQKSIEEIITTYKPKKYLILDDYHAKNQTFKEKADLLEKTIGKPDHPKPALLFRNGVMAQSYTWNKVFSLIQDDYDLIFKSRFDCSYKSPISFDSFKKNHFNCFDKGGQSQAIGDISFAGECNIIKKVMSDYHLDAFNATLPPIVREGKRWPEHILFHYLKHHQIKTNLIKHQTALVT